MQLYTVYENGTLKKVSKVDFSDSKVYIVDDINTIYLWIGLKSSKKKQDFCVKRANNLNDKRGGSSKIQKLKQNKEFGAFLAIMDILKKGVKKDTSVEKRPELELEVEETLELIDAGLEPDLEAEITLAAHDLLQKKESYKGLCKKLAELQLIILKGKGKASESEIKKKADEIRKSSSTEKELCWLIAELNLLIEQNKF